MATKLKRVIAGQVAHGPGRFWSGSSWLGCGSGGKWSWVMVGQVAHGWGRRMAHHSTSPLGQTDRKSENITLPCTAYVVRNNTFPRWFFQCECLRKRGMIRFIQVGWNNRDSYAVDLRRNSCNNQRIVIFPQGGNFSCLKDFLRSFKIRGRLLLKLLQCRLGLDSLQYKVGAVALPELKIVAMQHHKT